MTLLHASSRTIIRYKSRWNNTREARITVDSRVVARFCRLADLRIAERVRARFPHRIRDGEYRIRGGLEEGRDNVPYILSIICFGYINAAGKLSITHPQRNRTVRILYL